MNKILNLKNYFIFFLKMALENKNEFEIIKLLIKKCEDYKINFNENSEILLNLAIKKRCDFEIIKFLIKNGHYFLILKMEKIIILFLIYF